MSKGADIPLGAATLAIKETTFSTHILLSVIEVVGSRIVVVFLVSTTDSAVVTVVVCPVVVQILIVCFVIPSLSVWISTRRVIISVIFDCVLVVFVQLRVLDFQCIDTLLEGFPGCLFPLVVSKASPVRLP